jgi:hypothetical protein
MLWRLRSALPSRWFPDYSPNIDALLGGFATIWSYLYSLLAFSKRQQRILTAESVFLDLASYDFLGSRIQRATAQNDDKFRTIVRLEILRPRVTRAALDQALFDLTGSHPVIFEPKRPADTGGYGMPAMGYGAAGGYGSMHMPFQFLVTAYRKHSGGIAGIAGYDTPYGGYGVGSIEYANASQIVGDISDDDIRRTVNSTISAGTVAWMRVAEKPTGS